jgi:HK97 gp10 family phage protein
MSQSVSVKFDADTAMAGLNQITDVMLSEVRPAAQAGAQILYNEVLLRVPVSKTVRKYKGKTITPGGLRNSIYQVFSQDNSDTTKAEYHVSWNYRKAPHGHLVEYGTATMAARPFLRPAYDAAAERAVKAADAYYTFAVQPKLNAL